MSEYYVVQDGGFDAGRIYDGPYERFPRAYKAKSRRERDTPNSFGYKVVK